MDRLIEDERGRKLLIKFLENHAMPFIVTVTKGRRRSIEQNRLSHLWYAEISEQSGHTPQYVKAFCKLRFGVPLLSASNERFRKAWEDNGKTLPYDGQVSLMEIVAVTSAMSTAQLKQYLDEVNQFFTERGLVLTVPDDAGLRAA